MTIKNRLKIKKDCLFGKLSRTFHIKFANNYSEWAH